MFIWQTTENLDYILPFFNISRTRLHAVRWHFRPQFAEHKPICFRFTACQQDDLINLECNENTRANDHLYIRLIRKRLKTQRSTQSVTTLETQGRQFAGFILRLALNFNLPWHFSVLILVLPPNVNRPWQHLNPESSFDFLSGVVFFRPNQSFCWRDDCLCDWRYFCDDSWRNSSIKLPLYFTEGLIIAWSPQQEQRERLRIVMSFGTKVEDQQCMRMKDTVGSRQKYTVRELRFVNIRCQTGVCLRCRV